MRARVQVLGAAAIAAAVLLLGIRFKANALPLRCDVWMFRESLRGGDLMVHHGIDVYQFMRWSIWIASPWLVTVVSVVLAGAAWRLEGRASAVLMGIAPPGALALAEYVLSPVVHRTLRRGTTTNLSFPSGHMAGLTALVTVVVVLGFRRGRAAGLAVAMAALVLLVATAFSLVRLGLHYASDVAGGAAVAVCVVLALSAALAYFDDWTAARTGQH